MTKYKELVSSHINEKIVNLTTSGFKNNKFDRSDAVITDYKESSNKIPVKNDYTRQNQHHFPIKSRFPKHARNPDSCANIFDEREIGRVSIATDTFNKSFDKASKQITKSTPNISSWSEND